jgi:hypothetical protein
MSRLLVHMQVSPPHDIMLGCLALSEKVFCFHAKHKGEKRIAREELTAMLTITFHTQSFPSRRALNSLMSSVKPPTKTMGPSQSWKRKATETTHK